MIVVITTYLFDLDDTIIDSTIYARIYPQIISLIKFRFDLTSNDLDHKAQELGLKKNKFSRWDTGELCKKLGLLKEYYAILEEQIKVSPVLHNMVMTVFTNIKSRKKKIAVVSNSMTRTIQLYIKRYKLNNYLDFVFSYDDAQSNKKNNEKYWVILIQKHKLIPKECLVVGDDSEQDRNVPRKLGFQTFLLKKPEDLRQLIV